MYRLLPGTCTYNYIMCDVWLTLSNEEVEHGEDDGVPTKHVVPTGPHASRGHSQTRPDLKGSL